MSLARYADEIDLDTAQRHLAEEGALGTDWRWAWSHVGPMHHTECPLYSPPDLNESRTGGQGLGQDVPGDVSQAILRAIWGWSPFWKGVALTVVILCLIAFAVWVSLSDGTKEQLLDVFSNGTVSRRIPEGAVCGEVPDAELQRTVAAILGSARR